MLAIPPSLQAFFYCQPFTLSWLAQRHRLSTITSLKSSTTTVESFTENPRIAVLYQAINLSIFNSIRKLQKQEGIEAFDVESWLAEDG